MRNYLFATVLLLLGGCAAIPLNPGAAKIRITQNEPKGCTYLGEATGHQGGSVVGKLTSNENMEIGARNSLKNQAMEMGGNVVTILMNRAGQTGSYNQYGGGLGQTNVTLTGIVFNCPESVMKSL